MRGSSAVSVQGDDLRGEDDFSASLRRRRFNTVHDPTDGFPLMTGKGKELRRLVRFEPASIELSL